MTRTNAPRSRKTTRPARITRKVREGNAPSRASDAGAWSLSGYIYQLLGSAAERLKLEEVPSASASDASIRFSVEQHGQDAAATGTNGVSLIQFKYSQNARQITPGELAEILLALEGSSKRTKQNEAVSWQLVTNRQLSPLAKRSHDAARRTKDSKARRVTRAGKASSSGVIARLGGKLELVPRDLDDFRLSLLDAANRFGVDDDGLARRVLDLLRHVATRAPNRREVSLQDLNQALAGYPDPKSIRLKDCVDDMRAWLETAVRGQGGIALGEAVERRKLRTLLTQRAALAIVHGPGGCGKTMSLFKALDQRLSDAIGLAGMIVEHPRTLGHAFDSWRNAKQTGSSPAEALHRLRVANSDVGPPVLVLGLDGFDEVSDSDERSDAEALIRYFYAMHVELHRSQTEPDGLLIVTCRNRDDVDDVVAPRGTGGVDPPEIPAFDVGEFTDEELAAVWALWFPEEAVPLLGLSDEMRNTVADTTRGATATDRFLETLRHPVLLGCTKTLTAEQRQRLYRGDAGERNQVLSSYFDWFTRKAVDRARCSRKKVLAVLKAAARATAGAQVAGTCDRETHWVVPAVEQTGQAPELVRQIFDDAVSAGVVITGERRYTRPLTTPVRWRWCFPEFAEHLASLA